MIDEIVSAIERCNKKRGIRCIVIQSKLTEPPVFSAGIDLTDLTGQVQDRSDDELVELIDNMQDKFSIIRNNKLPTIAVIDGLCMGAGLELALTCDFRLVTPRSQFALNEVKFGLVPDLGGTTYLIRLIGLQEAKKVIMLGEIFDAAKALDFGVIDWIADDMTSKLDDIISQLLENSESALREAKRIVNNSLDYDIETSLKQDGQAQYRLLKSGEPLKLLHQFLSR